MFSIKLSHLTSTKHSLFIQPTSINWTPNTGQVVFQHLQTQHWPRSTSWLSRITCPWSKLAPPSNHTLDLLFGKHQQPAAWWPYLDIIPQLCRLQKLKGDILEELTPWSSLQHLSLVQITGLLKSPTQGISYEALRQALCGSRASGGGGRHLEDAKVDRASPLPESSHDTKAGACQEKRQDKHQDDTAKLFYFSVLVWVWHKYP